jgi:hypothetical protein
MAGGHRDSEFALEVSLGNIDGYGTIDKFGRAPSGVQLTATDIWDRADATPTQSLWVAPTQARVHNIVSTAAGDTDGGAGLRTMRIWGLTSWGANEVSEDITLNGVTPVATTNSYVIIHRMKKLTSGASGTVGTITATAVTDGTVTAAMLPGQNQTQMAIFGVPSTCKLAMKKFYVSALQSAGAAVSIGVELLVAEDPANQVGVFTVKHTDAIRTNATSAHTHEFDPPKVFEGPCIVKIQCTATTADTDVSAGFDAILVAN